FTSANGDIISHDRDLNNDSEELHRFLVTYAAFPPSYTVQLRGTHKETHIHTALLSVDDDYEVYDEPHTVTIKDFQFSIDLTPHLSLGPTHWSLPDSEPAFRGLMVRQMQRRTSRPKPNEEKMALSKAQEHERALEGTPPWISYHGAGNTSSLQSSKTLRQWVDEYCASPKILKEFMYEKDIYGWDVQSVEKALRDKIKQTHYRGEIQVVFVKTGAKIYIRPHSRLSRLLSNRFCKILLWLILVYPLIWLWKRYSVTGGGRWEVCGAAYGMKHVEPLEADTPESEASPAAAAGSRVVDTPGGRVRLIGLSEGEWFRRWEGVVQHAVRVGLQRPLDEPMKDPEDGPADVAQGLWGYNLPTIVGGDA
ncbi:hypothetical protein BD779DRAFT_1450402, partial [Infundibulicybe gibba]